MKFPALLLLACTALSAPAWAQDASGIISGTQTSSTLDIASGALPKAPDGKLLTLTVDGVETPLAPGRYRGDVALTVTDDIPVQYYELPLHHFRTALYVEHGAPVWSKSVRAALGGGTVAAGRAENILIRSVGERFNGVLVTGTGNYVLDRPVIDMVGNGGNDFAGFGAAIMATGKAQLTLDRPVIRTRGAIRTALFVGGDAVVHVNGAEIETFNGTLPADYKFTVDVGRMMEVPWMLGLAGNVRSSNLVDRGTLYITDSHIRSEGWGALSTDDNQHVRMFVKNSLIELTDGGYGTYSIGDSVNVFANSIIRSPDIGGIMAAQGSLTLTDRTLVEAGTYGVMMHSGAGGGTLTIDKGTQLRAGRAAIEVKGIGTTIKVDGATITSGNRVILQAMENDDPFLQALMRGEIPEGMGAPPPGMGADGGAADKKGPTPNPAVVATFSNVDLEGDFWNGRMAQGGMELTFENARVSGRISTSTTAPASGKTPVRATYREIGDVTNTAVPASKPNAMVVRLGGATRWTVTGTSYLSSLTIAPGASIEGSAGAVVLTVNGRQRPIRPGTYTGRVTLSVQ
ncbi:hypothetical protein [Novosphingobium resinovorum]|uniref:hypothetical protein n=1 Tax=Novosphingobium resinovorum TaxID=158500 RepID=UPI002ED64B5B|nr:hypothetical protein [Novosphingobium resinovorum]